MNTMLCLAIQNYLKQMNRSKALFYLKQKQSVDPNGSIVVIFHFKMVDLWDWPQSKVLGELPSTKYAFQVNSYLVNI